MNEFDSLFEDVTSGRLKYKHIHFEPIENARGWLCKNNKTGDVLAKVEFYSKWKRHVIRMSESAIFDEGCLEDIVHFLKQLNGD